MAIVVEVWGEYACFSRPELKVERVSYEVITPSAARGILEAVCWKPAIKWIIDEIKVCNPIKFENIRRNEVNIKASANKDFIAANNDRAQRASLILKNVRYVITAHFEMTDRAEERDNEAKFTEMIKRRLRNGQYFHKPYLGVREFPAEIRLIENGKDAPAPIPESRALGLMLYDILYIKNEHNVVREFCPTFFMAEMENGSINLRNTEVLR
jgi:CRISPR-associated protein Cas5d